MLLNGDGLWIASDNSGGATPALRSDGQDGRQKDEHYAALSSRYSCSWPASAPGERWANGARPTFAVNLL
jgi:hypothetical protein